MRQIKPHLCIILAILLLAPVLPRFAPEDVTRDGTVDLRDAVQLARRLSGGIETAGNARKAILAAVLKAMQTTAGLRPAIRSSSRAPRNAPAGYTAPALRPSAVLPPPPTGSHLPPGNGSILISYVDTPPLPPPQWASIPA